MMSKIVERATELRTIIESLAQDNMNDEDALEAVELFQAWTGDAEQYAVDERVRYDGILYKCLQAHTSQPSWTPTDAPSLWARVLIPVPVIIPEWVQPSSTNPYMTGDKVKHNEKIWISIIDNNVWEPGIYGWNEVVD